MTWMMWKSVLKQVCRWHRTRGSRWHDDSAVIQHNLIGVEKWADSNIILLNKGNTKSCYRKGIISWKTFLKRILVDKKAEEKNNIPQGRILKFSRMVKGDDASPLLTTGVMHLKFCSQFCACLHKNYMNLLQSAQWAAAEMMDCSICPMRRDWKIWICSV